MKKRNLIIAIMLLLLLSITVYVIIDQTGILQTAAPGTRARPQKEAIGEDRPSTPDTDAVQRNGRPDSKEKQKSTPTVVLKENLKTYVYYFHHTDRDEGCRSLERLTVQSLYTCFKSHLVSGKLVWRSVNVDEPWNRHFADDFSIKRRSIVVVSSSPGKKIVWKVLGNAEEMAADRAGFMQYIKNEVSPLLEGH